MTEGRFYSDEEIQEIDRTARAYGFEVGRGKLATDQIEIEDGSGNPFFEKNWRELIGVAEFDTSPHVLHAKAELALAGNDADFNNSVVAAVRSFFSYGHSGGSASVGIELLYKLLKGENLTPLTGRAEEWQDRTAESCGTPLWQSRRNSEAFSTDGGKTYYLLSEIAEDRLHVTAPLEF